MVRKKVRTQFLLLKKSHGKEKSRTRFLLFKKIPRVKKKNSKTLTNKQKQANKQINMVRQNVST